ncbi:MAG TPA: response regulator, partial [Candidatus Saccharimonadia bacterium]|nr:response regulator [Candidatus Saccharimonadia bacterium]
ELVEADSVAAAAARISTDAPPYDLLLLDHELLGGEMAVAAAVAHLRALPGAVDAAILLLSAQRFRRTTDAQAVGASGCLAKPIRPGLLLEAIVRAFTGDSPHEKRAPVVSRFDGSLAERLPLHLLVADDNTVNQKVASMMLKRLGYTVDIVANGVEVLQALETRSYDIIFLDVQMPEMDGDEAARRIRDQWSTNEPARPRLIAMTGNAMQGDRERCLAAGMDDYITKPVRVEKLQAVLERWGPRPVAGVM